MFATNPFTPLIALVSPELMVDGGASDPAGRGECRSELPLAISGRKLAPTGVRIVASRRYVSDVLRYSRGFSAPRLAGSVKIASSAAACAVRVALGGEVRQEKFNKTTRNAGQLPW